MRTISWGGLVLAGLLVAGCAKTPPPESLAGMAPGEATTTDGTDAAADLQSALVAAAGADRVFFALDSSELTSQARDTLARQSVWLRQQTALSFTIEGHCDERGTREYNLALGQRRAEAVAVFLAAQGIDTSRLRTVSYGKERPDAIASDESAYARNRRAVSVVIDVPN
jgi:peptidoglycan-associated lipoprotein